MKRAGLDLTSLPGEVVNLRLANLAARTCTARHGAAQGAECHADLDALGLLDWGRRFLPHYFRSPPSAMHRLLDARFAAARLERGLKLNVVGPRGGAKSTVGTLAWVLR